MCHENNNIEKLADVFGSLIFFLILLSFLSTSGTNITELKSLEYPGIGITLQILCQKRSV